MKFYTGKLGTYEIGTRIRVEALNPRDAYDQLLKFLPINRNCGCDPEDQYISQIFEGDYTETNNLRCVYDYMNGFELYERKYNNQKCKHSADFNRATYKQGDDGWISIPCHFCDKIGRIQIIPSKIKW